MNENRDELHEQALQAETEYVSTYCVRKLVPGLMSVRAGLQVLYPTTIYAIDGDDTSGVVGLLYPDGTFLPAAGTNVGLITRTWNSEQDSETIRAAADDRPVSEWNRFEHTGKVAWDGVAAGGIVHGEQGAPHVRIEDASLMGLWPDKHEQPKPSRAITPEKARAEAQERELKKLQKLAQGWGMSPARQQMMLDEHRRAA